MAVKLLPLTHPWNLLATWLSFFSLGSALRVLSDLARICNKNQHSRQALSKYNSELWILKWQHSVAAAVGQDHERECEQPLVSAHNVQPCLETRDYPFA